MSLQKAIKHGKEKRRQYVGRDSRRFDDSCRNHGSCSYCSKNRQHKHKKAPEIEVGMVLVDKNQPLTEEDLFSY